jgi:hypothetical protein
LVQHQQSCFYDAALEVLTGLRELQIPPDDKGRGLVSRLRRSGHRWNCFPSPSGLG